MDPLRIMLLSDIHSPDFFRMQKLEKGQFDLVLTLGDIPSGTIDYILNQASGTDVYGVYGNHDPKKIPGLDTLDGKVIEKKGMRISGVSGIKKLPGFNQPYDHMYSEAEMGWKLSRLGRVDILVAHAAPYSLTKTEGPIHLGFKVFDGYIQKYFPAYFIFGHLGKKIRAEIGATHAWGIVEKDYLIIEKPTYTH